MPPKEPSPTFPPSKLEFSEREKELLGVAYVARAIHEAEGELSNHRQKAPEQCILEAIELTGSALPLEEIQKTMKDGYVPRAPFIKGFAFLEPYAQLVSERK